MRKAILLFVASMLLCTFTVSAANDTTISAGILPDSKFYPIESFWENTRLAFTFGDEAKAEYHLTLANRRLAEYTILKAENKNQLAEQTRMMSEQEDAQAEIIVNHFGQNISDLAKRKLFQEKKDLILAKRLAHIEYMEKKKGEDLSALRYKILTARANIQSQIKDMDNKIKTSGGNKASQNSQNSGSGGSSGGGKGKK